jgi:hypothetical protein
MVIDEGGCLQGRVPITTFKNSISVSLPLSPILKIVLHLTVLMFYNRFFGYSYLTLKMVKKILISGASGLIGGIIIEHLSKNCNYDIYGIDKHIGLSTRYQLDPTVISDSQKPILLFI